MSKLTCPIVRDLLPLYIDQVVSPETAQAVEDHLADCPDCQGEYESLQADLPVLTEEMDTSRQFGDMMKKTKRKDAIQITLVVVLLVAVMIGGFHLLRTPVRDNTGVTIHRVYEVEDPVGNTVFFILYHAPTSSFGISHATYIDELTGKFVLQLDSLRRPLHRKIHAYFESYDLCWVNEARAVDEVRLGNQVVWTRDTHGADPIPDYVYKYTTDHDDWTSWAIELDGKENYTNFPAPFVLMEFNDGSQIVWDLDGNVLHERP